METFYDRLLNEAIELDLKIASLISFIDSDKIKELDSVNETLLKAQLEVMKLYSVVVEARIKNLYK